MEARVLEPPPQPEPDPELFYHPHEEVNVPANVEHDLSSDYLRDGLSVYLPDHWVGHDCCCYWIEGNNRVFLGPDVFVAERARPELLPSSFRLWEHGPLLLVVEIASRSSFRRDAGPKLDRYAAGLRPAEYLHFDADRGLLRLFRLTEGEYGRVRPGKDGRLWSEAVGVSFGLEDGRSIRV